MENTTFEESITQLEKTLTKMMSEDEEVPFTGEEEA